MAIFHLAAKVVSRKAGQSVVAKAAYNAREELTEERTGEVKDYTRAEGLLFSGLYAPANAPEWAKDRAQLWNAADRAEKRKDAQLARVYDIALPHELTNEQRRFLVQDFVRDNFTRKGYAADVALHAPDREGDERNYHAHILVSDRKLTANGFASTKKERQQSKAEMKAELEGLRESWERTANRHLERHGHEARIDHRSLKDQGIDREATEHLGPYATQLERDGEESERGNTNREIEARNQEREEAQREYEAAQAEREQWEEKLAQAAIQKAEEEQKKEKEAERDEAKNGGLGKAAGDIRLAMGLSQSGEGFAIALGYRGYTLAHVSEQEAAASTRAAAFAKAIGQRAPEYQAGELIVINAFGNAHRLTERNTGKTRAELDKYLAPLQRDDLPTVTETREAQEQKRQAREAQQDKNRNAELGEKAADIRLAVALSQGGESFSAALKERCLVLAQVTEQEAADKDRAAAFAEELGHHAPRYNAGELVVMNEFGGIHRLTARTTGKTREELEKYLVQIKREGLPNAEQGKQEAVMLGQYKNRAELLAKQEAQKAELEKQQAERKEQREKKAREFEEKAKQEIDGAVSSKHYSEKFRLEKHLKENNTGFFGRTVARAKQFIGHKIDEHQAEKQKEKLHKAIVENDWRNQDRDEARIKRQDKAHERGQATVEIKQAQRREALGIHAPERDEALKAAQNTAQRTNTEKGFKALAEETTCETIGGLPTERAQERLAEWINKPAKPKEREESPLDKAIGAVGKGREAVGQAAKAADKGLRVIDKATGNANGLSKAAGTILEGIARPLDALASSFESLFGGASPPPIHRRARGQTPDQTRAAERALTNINQSIKRGDDINAADLRNLPKSQLERIRDGGDEYLMRMCQNWEIQQRERERENERER